MMLLAIGGIVGAFFAMPETMGPLLKFGLPIDDLIASSAPSEKPAKVNKKLNSEIPNRRTRSLLTKKHSKL